MTRTFERMSPVKSRIAGLRKAASTARLPSATVTLREPERSASAVEIPPPNCATNVFGFFLTT
jgi:hypothetical protein